MKRYILDSNIIIKDPSILKRWNSRYKIIIPDTVIEESSRVSGRIRGAENLPHLLDEVRSKGFIQVGQTSQNKYPYNDALLKDLRISYVDYLVAQFAKDYSKDRGETYLVTDDRLLLKYADSIGIKTLNLFAFQNDLLEYKTVNADEVGKNKTIRQFQFRHIAISFISGIVLTALSFIVYKFFDNIVAAFPKWGTICLLIIIPFAFYWVRSNIRIGYAIAEFSFGFYSCYVTLIPLLSDFKIELLSELTVIIPLVGGIYVMVRGLDNFSQGIKGTLIEGPWRKIFRD